MLNINIYALTVIVRDAVTLTVYAWASSHDKARQYVTERLVRDGYANAEIATCEFLTRDAKGLAGETHINGVDGE